MAQVSSYNVANRSGAQVRADINDIYSAIKTCNSGPNNPASPERFMLFGDDTVGDLNLKIHDGSQFRVIGKVTEDNLGLLPRAGGTMTGQIFGDDASVAGSPAYAFDNDPDTGMFRNSANSIQFATGGTARLTIGSDGTASFQEQTKVGGTPPWTIASGDHRSLSVSGNSASTSGYLMLGNVQQQLMLILI